MPDGHLSPAQVRAYVIADNKLAALAGWDKDLLGLEIAELSELDIDLDLTVSRGNKNSPNKYQQNPYATVRNKEGKVLDKDGKIVDPSEANEFRPSTNERAHIPIADLNPKNY